MDTIETRYNELVESAQRQPGVREVMELFNSCKKPLEIAARHRAIMQAEQKVSVSNSSNILS
jgi:hypothetical protein